MGARSSRNTTQNNRSDGHLLEYFRNTFVRGGGGTNAPPPPGLTATGGVISDYTDGPAVYRAHVFTSTGTFTVSALSTNHALPDSVEYLVVAGGGGGGSNRGGGGGAGGYRTSVVGDTSGGGGGAEASFPVSTSPGSYTITVGGGGSGGQNQGRGTSGNPSVFDSITSTCGGG